MKKDITTVNVSEPDYAGKLTHKEVKLIGKVDLSALAELNRHDFDFLDISEAEFGIDQEEWSVCLGWSHCGPVYGNSGWRDVEVLKRFLEEINAKVLLLPDNVQRRHINAAKKNPTIDELQVSPNCPLFSFEDGKLMNKKKTKPVFNCKAYTVTGEIRGEWHTYHPTVDIMLTDVEVKQIKKLVSNATTDNFLYILKDKMPKLYKFLDWHFYDLAWKQVVKDGMDYYNLSRREAENAEMTGNEYSCLIPEEFEAVD
jgi:hypothetical protein